MQLPTLTDIYSKLNNDIKWVHPNTIFLTLHGSHAYGLATPESDIDLRGITIPPKNYMLGFARHFDDWVANDPYDIQVFSLRKFFNLTKDGNPNTLELLFTDPSDHLFVSDIGKTLLEHKDKFLSRNLKERYLGYAKAQVHRAQNHKRWLDGGDIKPPPTREEFGLPKKLTIPKDQLLTVQALISKKLEDWNCDFEPFSEPQKIYLKNKVSALLAEMDILKDDQWMLAARSLGMSENFILVLNKEKAYQSLVSDYENYLTWKKNRNPKRAALEAKIGYDAKHITQVVRLLLLGKEILETGKVKVKRIEDREMLMEIKECKVPYEKVIDMADKIEDEVEQAYFKSPLPIRPDIEALDKLCIQLIEEQWKQ